MSFGDAIRTCLGKYATFSGRAARPEYWWFFLFVILVSIVLSFVDRLIFGVDPVSEQPRSVLGGVWALAMFLPMLGAGWRRMHDTGRPGWYLLIPLAVSLVGSLLLGFGTFGVGALESMGTAPTGSTMAAAGAGLAVLAAISVVQIVVAILIIWWLSRPGEPGPNAWGPPPAKG